VSGRIPQAFLDELLARTDLVELIAQRLPLKRAGREFKALCPFHDERTPSFTVSPRKQFYHCFGCGAHGDAIRFLMDYDHLSFRDAVEELAGRLGMSLPESPRGQAEETAELYQILARAAAFYRAELEESAEARRYLEGRGVDRALAERFGLGHAPPGPDRLLRSLGRDAATRQALLAAGLALNTAEGLKDRFRARLMFPILDTRGRPIAFGGRLLGAGEPKYLNSPETVLFHKGRQLYALWQARQAGPLSRLIVVEGYMDAITLHGRGFPETVATLGTAITADQVELLFRNASDVIYCFDGDRAGRQAAWRAAEATLARMREGRQAKLLFLPEGEDPDSLVRARGGEALAALLEQAVPLSEFVLQRLSEGVDFSTIEGRARFAERAEALLGRVPEGAFRDLFADEIERRSGRRRVPARPATAAASPRAPRRVARTPMRTAIGLLLQWPSLAGEVEAGILDQLAGSELRGIPVLLELLALARERPGLPASALLAHFEGRPEHRALAAIAGLDWPDSEDAGRREFRDALVQIRRQTLTRRLAALRERMASAGAEEGAALSEALRETLRALAALRTQVGSGS
jgi:DNA primase